MLRRNRRYNRDDRYSRREYDRREDRYDRREYDRYEDDRRYRHGRYEDDRRYRHGRYEDEDYDYNPHDTITGRLIEGISNAFTSKKKKAVKCENVTFDSAKKTGSYKNLKTGEVIKCEDP